MYRIYITVSRVSAMFVVSPRRLSADWLHLRVRNGPPIEYGASLKGPRPCRQPHASRVQFEINVRSATGWPPSSPSLPGSYLADKGDHRIACFGRRSDDADNDDILYQNVNDKHGGARVAAIMTMLRRLVFLGRAINSAETELIGKWLRQTDNFDLVNTNTPCIRIMGCLSCWKELVPSHTVIRFRIILDANELGSRKWQIEW